ncbi:MAG: ATP-dependent helicase [Niabella sp.]
MTHHKQTLEEKFNEVYNGLNKEQQMAVDTLEGPVMVIAGPGTGKTQILAARIGKILLTTDADPENILCLTYTDAGVVAMRKRLQQFIGAAAYKVNIYTFHAFCNDVIQDNLHLFERTALDPVSDLERIDFFKTLIDSFGKEHPLKRYRGDVYYEVNNLQQLFSTMKREGWTTPYLNEKIDGYIESLPERDEFKYKRKYKQYNAGDLKEDAVKEATEKAEKLRAAVNEFDRFQAIMRKHNRYDFDDMINWVIQAFEENPNLLADYQEQYQYILVDEFQDTSGTQNKIIQLLINYWEQPNVFVVGDDDQSIYRFQGANVENMLEFANQYAKHLHTIVLTKNYRSTQPILDVSKSVIDNNEERLIKKIPGLNKNLMAANEAIKNLQHLPLLLEYNSVAEEMAGITLRICQLVNNGAAPGKIAVIYKENKYGEELAQYLAVNNVPVYTKRNINLLNEPFIKKIITILRYLNAEHDIPYGGDEYLFEILHYDFYKIPPIEIAKLTVEANKKRYDKEEVSLRSLLADKSDAPQKDLFDAGGIYPQLKEASHILEQLIADVSNITLQQLLDHVIRNAGVLKYVLEHPQKVALINYLTAFFNFVKEENRRRPTMTLASLISLIDLMEQEAVPLPMVRVTGNDKGVNLLTAHGSKGLEFEYVFLAGTNANNWEKKRKPGGGYKIPDTVFSSVPEGDDQEELRRVFYVALTRAEKELFISYAKRNNDNKELEPSQFIAEIKDGYHLETEPQEMSTDELAAFQQLLFTNQQPVLQATEDDFINALLEKFVMNVTALNNYLSCPLKFYYQNLIRIPSGRNEATEFGSAIHFSLERLFRKMKASDDKEFEPVANVIDDFNWYLQRHRENFTKEAYERRLEQGSIIIPEYYNKYIDTWNKVALVEVNIRGVVVNGVPLKGKLDKIEFTGNDVNVVDYKTGNADKAKTRLKGPSEKEPNGGDYWRQAIFYKLLVDNYPQKNWHVVSTEFDFIEPDSKKNFIKEKVAITPADIETVKQQVGTVWNSIQQKDFYKGCGKPDCHWCNFVKDNSLFDHLEVEEAEET